METHTHLAPEAILKQGTETTIAYLKALQKQLDFAKHEFEEQYAINQELIHEKIWLMAYLYAFVTHFQMQDQNLESFLESQWEFIHTQHAFIQEDFTHEHKDLHNLQRFCAAFPIVQPKTQ